uniref:Uncharacterized protein n=1 Tax=Oryza barthii TaxID=65489 RepID=A0A0D3GPP9_9ORYZ
MAAVDPHRAFRIQCSAVRRARAAVQIRSGPPMVTACVSCVNDGKLSPSSRQIGCRRRLASRQLGCKVAVLDVVMFVDMDFQNKLIDSLSRICDAYK